MEKTVATSFEGEIVFALPDGNHDHYSLSDAVAEAGFPEALIGTGLRGFLGVDIDMTTHDPHAAFMEAAEAILKCLPTGSRLKNIVFKRSEEPPAMPSRTYGTDRMTAPMSRKELNTHKKIANLKSRFAILALFTLVAASTGMISSKASADDLSHHDALVESVSDLKQLTSTMVDGLAESQTDLDEAIIPVRENIQQQITLVNRMIESAEETDQEALTDIHQALVSLESTTHGLEEIQDLKAYWEAMSDLLMAWKKHGALSSKEDL